MRFTHNARKSSAFARRVLYPAEMLVLLFCSVRKPALARVVRENLTRWGRSTCLTLATAPEYFRTLTQGAGVLRLRQTCLMSERSDIGQLIQPHWAQTSPLAQIIRAAPWHGRISRRTAGLDAPPSTIERLALLSVRFFC